MERPGIPNHLLCVSTGSGRKLMMFSTQMKTNSAAM
jgi:hypothetical protein